MEKRWGQRMSYNILTREWRINAATQARENSNCKSRPAASFSHGEILLSRLMHTLKTGFTAITLSQPIG